MNIPDILELLMPNILTVVTQLKLDSYFVYLNVSIGLETG